MSYLCVETERNKINMLKGPPQSSRSNNAGSLDYSRLVMVFHDFPMGFPMVLHDFPMGFPWFSMVFQ